jgi:hypothetical protein
MGEHDAHSRVGIWTECQRTDTLLAEVPHFLFRRNAKSITASLASRAPKLTRIMNCFAPLSPQLPGVAFAATKRSLQSGNHDRLGSPWFVAAGVLTAGMMM